MKYPFSFGGGGDFSGAGAGGSWDDSSPTITADSSSQNYS